MNRFIRLFIFVLICWGSLQYALATEAPIDLPPAVCYASPKVSNTRIPPPAAFRKAKAAGLPAKSYLYIAFNGSFPTGAQTAFAYAASIWGACLTSTVPIHVQANWTTLESGALANSKPGKLILMHFNGAHVGVPLALANANQGWDYAPNTPDIIINVSSSINWYFGTDGYPTSGSYDFVTCMMHEMAHGLGIIGSMRVEGGVGRYNSAAYRTDGSFSNVPTLYDYFSVTYDGRQLINTTYFSNETAAIAQVLTSVYGLYFGGGNATAANIGMKPRLYAPAAWDSGSSQTHLNEEDYDAGHQDSLMTPFLGQQEVIHDPGPIVLGMLRDMYWSDGANIQPDLGIRLLGDAAYLGADELTPVNSPTTILGYAGTAKPAIYEFQVKNNSEIPQPIKVYAQPNPYFTGMSVRVFDALSGGQEITQSVLDVQYTYTTDILQPGEARYFRMEVSLDPVVSSDLTGEIYLSARTKFTDRVDVALVQTKRAIGRPDLLISAQSPVGYLGGQIYNDLPSQTVLQSGGTGEKRIYLLRAVNNSTIPDDLTITTVNIAGVSTSFYTATANGMNITQQVKGGGWTISRMAPGQVVDFRVEVTTDTSVLPSTSRNVLVIAASGNESVKTDEVQATVRKAPLSAVAIQVYPTSPQLYTSYVDVTAVPTGGNNLEYAFGLGVLNGATWSWSSLRGYGSNPTYLWHPTAAGTYKLSVWAREKTSTAQYDKLAFLDYQVNHIALSQVTLTARTPAPVIVGTPVRLLAQPQGGVSLRFKFLAGHPDRYGNTIWEVISDWGETTRCTWTPSLAVTYALAVQCKEAFSLNTYDCVGTLNYQVKRALTAVGLTASPASPQPVKTPITLTATPADGVNREYKFRAGYKSGSTWIWTTLADYGPAATCAWTPQEAHIYTLAVWAREVGHTTPYDVGKTISYTVTSAIPAGVTLYSPSPSPQPFNTPITLYAVPNGSGSLQYQFRVGYRSSTGTWVWSTLQAYSSADHCTWTPTAARTYTLVVDVRPTGGTLTQRVSGILSFTITPPLFAVNLALSPAPSLLASEPITLTATKIGGAQVEYRFTAVKQGDAGEVIYIRDYVPEKTCTWTPGDGGIFTITVTAREKGSTATVSNAKSYTVLPPLTAVSLSTTPASPQPANTAVLLHATATGGEHVQYLFRAGLNTGGTWTWTVVRGYADSPDATWTPAVAGAYTLTVWSREAGSPNAYDAVAILAFKVTAP